MRVARLRAEADERHDRFVVGQHPAETVDEGEPLPTRIDDRAEVRAGPAHRLGDACLAHDAVDGDDPGRLRVRVDAEHIGADLRQQVGHDEAGGAIGKIEHELHVMVVRAAEPEGLDHVARVVLDNPG